MEINYHTVHFTLEGSMTIELLSKDKGLIAELPPRLREEALFAAQKALKQHLATLIDIPVMETCLPYGKHAPAVSTGISVWVTEVSANQVSLRTSETEEGQ